MGERRTRIVLASTALVLGLGGAAYATHMMVDTDGHTTLEQVLTESNDPNYKTLSVDQVNEDYIVRAPATTPAQAGRATRRTSLAYFAQLTDFQLADEESPARVEFADPGASSAWRPQEAFHPQVIDASIKQINRFVPSSVVPQGNGMGNAMDFALMTGDQADNAQRNEFRWTRELIEGGTSLNFNSGVTDPGYYASPAFLAKPSCVTYLASELGNVGNIVAEAAAYTGVQDYDDYPAPPGPAPAFYDPDQPLGQYADWPMYTGLMDRAQTAFTPAGLDVPSYWSNGNHDVLVQGNEDAVAPLEDIATACFKALGTTLQIPPSAPGPDFVPDPNLLLSPLSAGMLVPPDPERRFLDRPQIKQVLGTQDNGHGFDFVDPAEETASAGNASYYAWDPPQTPGFRFINVDTNSEGGQTAEGVAAGSSNGNIDDPQFQWLTDELDAAQAADKLIVIYGHHPVRSMNTMIADEQAGPCVLPNDSHGDTPEHNTNPGCDRDTRNSLPLHLGTEVFPPAPGEKSFVDLLADYPNVLAYVAGHTHEHRLIPFTRPDQSTWWEINSSATADWPQQHRLIEVMDNRDDTLSIFGTVLDAAAPSEQPAEGPAAAFDTGQLASIGRTLSFNDPDNNQSGEGTPQDRNVEMLLDDPREADVSVTKSDAGFDPVTAGGSITYDIDVTNNDPTTTATLVNLADVLPPTANYSSANPTQGTCAAPVAGTVNCALGDIAPGQTVSVSVIVSPQTAGTITNQVTASSVTDDPVPGNNVDLEQTTINPAPGSADLAIAKQASSSSLTLGQQLTYTLTVTNNGPDAATGVATTDTLPNGAGFVSANATQGTCSNAAAVVTCPIGSIASGDSETVTIITTTQLVRTLVNNASVAGGVGDPASLNNTASATTVVNAPPIAGTGTGTGGGGTPVAARGRCRGQDATITGTTGADVIRGTAGRDVIAAGAGRDRVSGLAGNDVICGHGDRDRLFGGAGRDTILGGNGNDLISGGKGRNRLRGGKGRDRCPKKQRCGVK